MKSLKCDLCEFEAPDIEKWMAENRVRFTAAGLDNISRVKKRPQIACVFHNHLGNFSACKER